MPETTRNRSHTISKLGKLFGVGNHDVSSAHIATTNGKVNNPPADLNKKTGTNTIQYHSTPTSPSLPSDQHDPFNRAAISSLKKAALSDAQRKLQSNSASSVNSSKNTSTNASSSNLSEFNSNNNINSTISGAIKQLDNLDLELASNAKNNEHLSVIAPNNSSLRNNNGSFVSLTSSKSNDNNHLHYHNSNDNNTNNFSLNKRSKSKTKRSLSLSKNRSGLGLADWLHETKDNNTDKSSTTNNTNSFTAASTSSITSSNINNHTNNVTNGSSLTSVSNTKQSIRSGSHSITSASPNFLVAGGAGSSSNTNNNSTTNSNIKDISGRLLITEDGSHEHILKAAKRQEKISTLIKNFLGAKKLRDESKSAVQNLLPNVPPSLVSGFMNRVDGVMENDANIKLSKGMKNNPNYQRMCLNEEVLDSRSFLQKYGLCQEVIGRGAFGVVKIAQKKISDHKLNYYAVKEFCRRAQESEKDYSQRLAREFCISSSLKNIHIINTLDLLKDAKGDYCEVMEFCSGGDLYTLVIAAGKLEYIEADCFFKQLVRGVSYMHTMGVAHRDIKPENILLTADGNLKITDFGTSECFSYAWEEDKIYYFQGVIGSLPYIAPELYLKKDYDLRPADVWACGVVYMAMRTGRQLWRTTNNDEFYEEYLAGRKDAKGYGPIESLKRARCRNVIYSILDPVPSRRITAKQILNSEWGREIRCCDAGEQGTKTDNIELY